MVDNEDPPPLIEVLHNGGLLVANQVIDYGTINAGQVVSKTFQLRNAGGSDLSLPANGISITGSEFQVVNAPSLVPAGGTRNFDVRTTGQGSGLVTRAVTVDDGNGPATPFTFRAKVDVDAPFPIVRVQLRGAATPFPNFGSYQFGQATLGSPMSAQFEICNDGTQALTLLNPNALVGGQYYSQTGSTPSSAVTPGACVEFGVLFDPLETGVHLGGIDIRSDDPATPQFLIELWGSATAPPSISPEILIDLWNQANSEVPNGGSYVFPWTPPGGSSEVWFALENTGQGNLLIDNPSSFLSGEGFNLTGGGLGSQYSPGLWSAFRITFSPEASFQYGGTITIQNNDPDEDPYVINLSGAGGSGNAMVKQFTPTDDAFTTQSSPDNNRGSDHALRVRAWDTGWGRNSYIKFRVWGVTGPVESAKLLIRTQETMIPQVRLYDVHSDAWSEETITWNNASIEATLLETFFNLSPYTWHELDVSGIITGNGTYTLGLTSSTANVGNLDFWSKESSYAPVLQIVHLP